ncbi:hypothetical protein [Nostoc phage NMeng1]|nr:hypothetical protein [Nostoc phage NMeng1]
MCDPLTLLLGVGSVLGGAASLMAPDPPQPPEAVAPAAPAPTSRNPGAIVRLGNNSDDIKNTVDPADRAKPVFQEQRASGFSLGALGKSGLSI